MALANQEYNQFGQAMDKLASAAASIRLALEEVENARRKVIEERMNEIRSQLTGEKQ